jgi:fructosamine-3-kinase
VQQDTISHLERLLSTPIQAARDLGSQHGVSHHRLELADGRAAFAKVAAPPSTAGFAAEAAGLDWLAEPRRGGRPSAPVPAVLASDESCLVIEWLDAGSADHAAASRLGRELAALHTAGSDQFGAPWPGVIAGLPLPNEQGDNWPEWYARRRLLPYARIARDTGTLTAADVKLVESVVMRIEELAGPPEPPSRIHGDCWSGNVLWCSGRGWLIDPAAHGGHRETDLAMLALFGAPFLDRILASYQEVAPLADGWRARVPLHQLHPLLVHVCLFGSAYRESTLASARSALAG